MLPFKTIITINKSWGTPVYVQIANAIIQGVVNGHIPAGFKMPGTRNLSEEIGVHRKTVIAAYYELEAQGWVDIYPVKGAFITREIDENKPISFAKEERNFPSAPNFDIAVNTNLDVPVYQKNSYLEFNGGSPDVRLVPFDDIARAYRKVLLNPEYRFYLSYKGLGGSDYLKTALCKYLNESRGLKISNDNVHICRGSSMALYLSAHVLLKRGDKIVVGETSYHNANLIFTECGAEIIRIPVDDNGLVIDALENILTKTKIRALYLTPHHHYPTTVTLSIERRIRLLELAYKYNFIIFEDDYDYDFHYKSSPILPLAANDKMGNVIYMGSFSKNISTGFRLGYIIAPPAVIKEVDKLRHIIDAQGDNVFELAFAHLLEDGTIKRHVKKVQKIYHRRRDFFCKNLQAELGDAVSFTIPDGGMAIWAKFRQDISLLALAKKMKREGVHLSNGTFYNPPNINLNATRMGFAAMNFTETEKAIGILKKCI